ncbi:MAG: polyprenol monophosphomannose synthase [Anaerolineae bacterium]|nr:polyprenol monophosphomannose synthase [Anaerolineae bacterium]
MPRVIIVIPTYNEAENITRLIDSLFSLSVPDLELLIVDDNSPDKTGQIAEQLSPKYGGRVHVLHRAGKQGLGTAYIEGFNWALNNGADYIGQMDADFSHHPKYVPQLVESIQKYDAVIGSRYTAGGKLDERWSPLRKLLSWWANRVWVGFILQTPVKDNTGGFRMWRRKTLIGMDLRRVRSNGYVFQVEITYIALKLGYSFGEVPIYFADRELGKSKLGFGVSMEAALRVIQVWFRHRHLTPADRAAGG